MVVGLAVLLASCGPNPNGSHLNELRTAAHDLQAAEAAYLALPVDSILTLRLWAMEQLQDFELLASDSGVVLTRAEGAIVAEVGRVRRLIKDNPSRVEKLQSAQKQAISQIEQLIQAVESGATVDGEGTVMDSTYFNRQVRVEVLAAQGIRDSWTETASYAEQALSMASATKHRADSLGVALRMRLAAWVLDHPIQ